MKINPFSRLRCVDQIQIQIKILILGSDSHPGILRKEVLITLFTQFFFLATILQKLGAKCHLSQLTIQKYRTIFTDYFLILQQVEELMDERKQLEEACAKLKRYLFSRQTLVIHAFL